MRRAMVKTWLRRRPPGLVVVAGVGRDTMDWVSTRRDREKQRAGAARETGGFGWATLSEERPASTTKPVATSFSLTQKKVFVRYIDCEW